MMQWLMENDPGQFRQTQLRTLQRRVCQWRVMHGSGSIFFPQTIQPGIQSQSDYTWCNELNITIAGEPFEHMLFHFMLPYSRWETASIAFTESFQSLTEGYAAAVKELGGVAPEHRTQQSGSSSTSWSAQVISEALEKDFLGHFSVKPTSTIPIRAMKMARLRSRMYY